MKISELANNELTALNWFLSLTDLGISRRHSELQPNLRQSRSLGFLNLYKFSMRPESRDLVAHTVTSLKISEKELSNLSHSRRVSRVTKLLLSWSYLKLPTALRDLLPISWSLTALSTWLANSELLSEPLPQKTPGA